MTILVFDIETIPDLENARKIYKLDNLSDTEVYQAVCQLRLEKSGNTFLPHYLQRVISISLVLSSPSQFSVWSLGDELSSEKELITRFFSGLEKHTPTLVSWNGSGFDLPVLHYRALFNKVQAPIYWETGETAQNFRWNNYLNRYHYRHLDLMDILASYQAKAYAPLDDIATIIGFPGKMGMSGSHVWDAFQAGKLNEIRNYCETDVLNTYGVYLQFELMRGNMTPTEHDQALLHMETHLKEQNKPHLTEFLQNMKI